MTFPYPPGRSLINASIEFMILALKFARIFPPATLAPPGMVQKDRLGALAVGSVTLRSGGEPESQPTVAEIAQG